MFEFQSLDLTKQSNILPIPFVGPFMVRFASVYVQEVSCARHASECFEFFRGISVGDYTKVR